MARGWESKSVEDQIGDAEAAKDARVKRKVSELKRERQGQRESLLLSRAQIVGRLKSATNERYRTQLEKSLQHLDDQLEELGKSR